MPEEDPTLQFELNEEAIGLMLKSVSFYLERWPGGPDPGEQEGLIKLKSLLLQLCWNTTSIAQAAN